MATLMVARHYMLCLAVFWLPTQTACDAFKVPSCELDPSPQDCARVDVAPLRLALSSGGTFHVSVRDRLFQQRASQGSMLSAALSQPALTAGSALPVSVAVTLSGDPSAADAAALLVGLAPENIQGLAAGPALLTLSAGERQITTSVLLDSPLFATPLTISEGHPAAAGIRGGGNSGTLFVLQDTNVPSSPRQLISYSFASPTKPVLPPSNVVFSSFGGGVTGTILANFITIYQPNLSNNDKKLLVVYSTDGTNFNFPERQDTLALLAADPHGDWVAVATSSGLIAYSLVQAVANGPITASPLSIDDHYTPDIARLAVGDINGDKLAELVVIDQSNSVYVFRGVAGLVPSLVFDEELSRALTTQLTAAATMGVQAFTIADLDHDGRADVVLAAVSPDHYDWTLTIIPYMGGNRFAKGYRVIMPRPLQFGDIASVFINDLNGDGVNDVVINSQLAKPNGTGMEISNSVSVYINKTFTTDNPQGP